MQKKLPDLDKPWRHSKSFRKAYMTDMLQELVDRRVRVDPILIQRGWMEFDTVEDYEKALQWIKDKSIQRFIDWKKV